MNTRTAGFLSQHKISALAVSALLAFASTAMAQTVKEEYSEYEGGPLFINATTTPPATAEAVV